MSSSSEFITVLLADNRPLARVGFRTLLENAPDIQIVGDSENGEETKDLVAKLQPMVLILGLKMPETPPRQLGKWMRENHPETITLAVTAYDHDAYLFEMINAGLSGVLSETEPGENLIAAIRRAVRGENLLTPEQTQRALNWNRDTGKKWESLTKRERQTLALIEEGLGNNSISERLSVNLKTTEQYVSSILKKLNVTSRYEAGLWFTKNMPKELRENPV